MNTVFKTDIQSDSEPHGNLSGTDYKTINKIKVHTNLGLETLRLYDYNIKTELYFLYIFKMANA